MLLEGKLLYMLDGCSGKSTQSTHLARFKDAERTVLVRNHTAKVVAKNPVFWTSGLGPLAVLDGQPVLCVVALPPCFPPPLKHGLSPIPLDEVMQRHATKVTTINRTSKDKGVTFAGISHNCFVPTTPRADTPKCIFSIKVVSLFDAIQFLRYFQEE